ncbi:hypothetical protein K8R33_04215 [archaeon]|nr:hypothetical protein [archaeon]
MIFIINIGVVFADTPTPYPTTTPNYTAEPGYQPDVAEGLPNIGDNFSCPVGGIEGLGSCTPAPLWLFHCEHCIGGLPTVTPVITPTPQATPFPGNEDSIVTFASQCEFKLNGEGEYIYVPDVSEDYIDDETVNCSYSQFLSRTVYGRSDPTNQDYVVTFYVDYDLYVSAGGAPYCGYNREFRLYFINHYADSVDINVYDVETDTLLDYREDLTSGQKFYLVLGTSGNCEVLDEDWELAIEYIVNGSASTSQDVGVYDYKTSYWMSGLLTRIVNFRFERNYYVPEGEEEESSYCDEVVCQGETGFEEFGFSHSGLAYGNTYCLDLGPVVYEIFGFGINIPWIAHICFQQIGLGDVLLLGVNLSLDIVLLTITMAWFINIVFLS